MVNIIRLAAVWAAAGLFLLSSLFALFRSNYNAGTFLTWAITAALIAYGIFHRPIDAFCKKGLGRGLKYLFLAGVLVYAALFIFVAAGGYSGRARGDEKAYIVLGAGLRGERVSDVLRRRLDSCLAAFNENKGAFIVVCGGQGPGEAITEAEAMRRWLVGFGVPDGQIILEDKSTSTEENLLFAKELLAKHGIDSDEPIAVVTNAFHCYRAGQYARKLGFGAARTVPASMNIGSILPSYLREVLAIMYMWVFRRQLG